MTEGVLCEHEGTVATITLNRPEARNALTVDVKTRLLAELRRCGSEKGLRAVILPGPVGPSAAYAAIKESLAYAATQPGRSAGKGGACAGPLAETRDHRTAIARSCARRSRPFRAGNPERLGGPGRLGRAGAREASGAGEASSG